MRLIFACVLGLAVCIVTAVMLSYVGNELKIPSDIDLDGPTTVTYGSGRESYEEEVDSTQTSFGFFSIGLAIVLGIWAGNAVNALRWDGGFDREGKALFWTSFAGLTILVIFSGLTSLAFQQFNGRLAWLIRNALELAALLGVGWAMYQWHKSLLKTPAP